MTDTSGPWDPDANPGGEWSEADWARFASQWAPDGIIGASDFTISTSGLSITLGTGRAWVRGFGFERTSADSTAVTPNASASQRRDRIVLRRSLSSHQITPVVIPGAPSGSPVAPAISQVDTGDWDLPLYSFIVPANNGTAISGIVDERVTIATAAARGVAATGFGGQRVTGVGTPTASTDAATKGYVDALAAVGSWTDIAYSSGYSEHTVGDPAQSRLESPDIVRLHGMFSRGSSDITKNSVIGRITTAHRPSVTRYVIASGGGDALMNLSIATDGYITVREWQGSDMTNPANFLSVDGVTYDI